MCVTSSVTTSTTLVPRCCPANAATGSAGTAPARATVRCVPAMTEAVERWLPSWTGRLSPHVLRHYCASHLYEQGMTLKAIQELMGHSWLSTTTQYIHVHSTHIEASWASANERTLRRLSTPGHEGGMRRCAGTCG